MPFSYRRLLSDDIRLLQVASRPRDRILRFRTRHYDRSKTPKYTAVSYTWGNEEATETIWLDDEQFRIRPNLWGCLHYLIRDGGWKYIWADAICIDQSSIEEKNSQVRAMNRTYADAGAVSVWLGFVKLPDDITYVNTWPEAITTVDTENWDFGDDVQDIANRPYWTRFWVVQEFLLARQIHIWCSGNVTDEAHFKAAMGLETEMDLNGPEGYEQSSTSKLKALQLLTGRQPDRHPELKQSLYELLLHHRNFDCKDPRDRVFSLLSLMHEDDQTKLYSIFPDYNLSHDEVVVITLSYSIEHCQIEFRERPNLAHLFQALGVENGSRRKRLLAFADRYHYSDAADGCRVRDLVGWDDEAMPLLTINSFLDSEQTPLLVNDSWLKDNGDILHFERRTRRRAWKPCLCITTGLSLMAVAGLFYIRF